MSSSSAASKLETIPARVGGAGASAHGWLYLVATRRLRPHLVPLVSLGTARLLQARSRPSRTKAHSARGTSRLLLHKHAQLCRRRGQGQAPRRARDDASFGPLSNRTPSTHSLFRWTQLEKRVMGGKCLV
eukprot:6200712-Pleurochrysis_carterae.AAC.5